MNYQIVFKPKAIKDLKSLPRQDCMRILEHIDKLQNNLFGDVKRLTHFTPEYRLRIGNYRVLFEIENEMIEIYRIMHRKEVYRRRS